MLHSLLNSVFFMRGLKTTAFAIAFLVGLVYDALKGAAELVQVGGLLADIVLSAFVIEFLARIWHAIDVGSREAEGSFWERVSQTAVYVLEAIWDRVALYLSLLVVLLAANALHNTMLSVETMEHVPATPTITGGILLAVYVAVFVLLVVETIVWLLGSRTEAYHFLTRLSSIWKSFKEREISRDVTQSSSS